MPTSGTIAINPGLLWEMHFMCERSSLPHMSTLWRLWGQALRCLSPTAGISDSAVWLNSGDAPLAQRVKSTGHDIHELGRRILGHTELERAGRLSQLDLDTVLRGDGVRHIAVTVDGHSGVDRDTAKGRHCCLRG